MSAAGWILAGLAGVALYEATKTPAKPATSDGKTAPPVMRWSIKKNIVLSPVSSEFLVGDLVTVTLVDASTNAQVPMILSVANNLGDKTGQKGLDAVYDLSKLSLPPEALTVPTLSGLPIGTHFAVFPLDISNRVPAPATAIPGGPAIPTLPSGTGGPAIPFTTLFPHKLLVSDLEIRPLGFAMLAGFANVNDFFAANPEITLSDSDATRFLTDPATFQMSVKSGDIDTIVYRRATPWSLGQTVFTKTDLGVGYIPTIVSPTAAPFGMSLAGERSPSGALPFGQGRVPFGGAGWGKKARPSYM